MFRKELFLILCLVQIYFAQKINILDNEIISNVKAKYNISINQDYHPDVGLDAPELIQKYGYPIEIHEVITSDNYVLTMHRIPYGRKNIGSNSNRPVIFLMHGLLASSADWILMGPDTGLAYLLADMGFDVWLGNARGNTYSKRHLYLDPKNDSQKFWDFSWHEIGVIDLPTMIDDVLYKTFNKTIFYIGHSQGATTFFVMTSTFPQYNAKIRLMIAFAPAVFMSHLTSPIIRILLPFQNTAKFVLDALGQYEFLPRTNYMKQFSSKLCGKSSITHKLCSNIVFLLVGFDEEQLNKTMLPVILSNLPAGSATKQLIHFAQGVRSRKFQQFDYGRVKNLIKYGSITPPEYDLQKVTVPVAIYAAENDLMVAKEDVDLLYDKLPNAILKYIVPFKQFSHLDFLWAIDVIPLLYDKVFRLLQYFNKK